MKNLTEARELLARAVETQGRDFVYQSDPTVAGQCWYVPRLDRDLPETDPRTKTGCLIGVALKLDGVPEEELDRNGSIGVVLANYFPTRYSGDVISYFGVAQRAQDSGKTWGEAFGMAEQWAERCMNGVG